MEGQLNTPRHTLTGVEISWWAIFDLTLAASDERPGKTRDAIWRANELIHGAAVSP